MKWWTINVTGYGAFAYFGTREQADERAKDKGRWEGGRATARESTADEAKEGADDVRWRKANRYPLERWERDALSLS